MIFPSCRGATIARNNCGRLPGEILTWIANGVSSAYCHRPPLAWLVPGIHASTPRQSGPKRRWWPGRARPRGSSLVVQDLSPLRARLLLLLAGPRIDLNGGGHPGRKHHALGYLIDVDAHRNALRQTHPGEDRVDLSQPLPVGLRVCDVDAAGDTVDMAAGDLAVSHQLDFGRVAHLDRLEIGLLEITVDPKRIGIDKRDHVRSDAGVVALLRQQVGHPAVDRRANLGAVEVHSRLVEISLRLL